MQDNNDHEADRSRSLHVRLGSVRNPIPRRLADLIRSGRENINGGISFDSLQCGGSETYISLNEVIQNNRERIETRSTERYFSPDDVGSEQRQETTHEVRHVHFNPQQQNGTDGSISQEPTGITRPITREETFHSRTTTLVGSRRESIAEENVESSTPTINITDELGFDVDDADLFAVSPILGVTRLPSLYDTANHVHNSPSQRPTISTPLSARFPTINPPLNTAQTSSDTDHEEPQAASNSNEESPPSASSSTIEPESTQDDQTTMQAANEPTTMPNENQQLNEGVVESSLLLQVSIVGRSSENLPIALEDNNHSTLEYVQFIETASYRQYSFTSEHLNVPEGFLRRSTSGIRRMLSARNRFIAARSRSLLRRLQREVDLEMQNPDAAWQEPDNQPEGPIELEAIPAGPFEVGISTDPEDWGRWGARPELARGSTFTRNETMSRMTCAIFGPNLPRQLGQMCKVYMKQLDDQLSTSIRNYELQTPNFLNWPNPLSYLSECLKLVAKQMEAAMSIEDFVQHNLPHLMHLMAQGPGPARGASERENSPVQNSDFVKLAHEWMLFCLEAWTMLDMTAICKNRHDLRLSDNFCKSPLKDTIESLLPRLAAKYTHHFNTPLPYAHGKATQIFPHEMTAEMLQDLGGVTFVWTNDIAQHLALDTKMKTVGVYSHVAFAYLHAEAGTDSSLSKSGLTTYHHLLTEIAESYRLLFGSSERSRKIFHNLDSPNRSPGYFDIFTLHNRPDNSNTTKPKWLYNTVDDFPVFGDRLIELRGLLKPKGLRGLWRDTRDSLQWYTFWAVAIIGAVSLLLGFIQMALGAVQAYASLKALGD